MTSTVIEPSDTVATSMACQTVSTTPNPAVISIPSAHDRYSRVTALRGRPTCPITTAARTDATPPAPNTRPRSVAEPFKSFLTTYGTRVSQGPQVQSKLTNAPTMATQIHV